MKALRSLLRAVRERENVKEQLSLFKYQLFLKLPPKSFDDLEIPLPVSVSSITDEHEWHHWTALHVKMIERSKATRIALLINVTENKLRHCEQQVETEIYKMWHPSLSQTSTSDPTTTSNILRH